jgi:hypothetical protein
METTNNTLAKFEEFFAKLTPEERANPDVQDMSKKLLEKKAQVERDAQIATLLTSVNKTFGTTAKSFKDFAKVYLKMVSPKKSTRRAKPLTAEQVATVKKLFADGKTPAAIASATGFKYPQVFKLKPSKGAKSRSTLRGS